MVATTCVAIVLLIAISPAISFQPFSLYDNNRFLKIGNGTLTKYNSAPLKDSVTFAIAGRSRDSFHLTLDSRKLFLFA